MNKPTHPVAATPIAYPDYDQDAYGWAIAQAAIIRSGRLDSIDWGNVADEIESVGRSERSAYKSHLVNILVHMIKWDVQPERRGKSWWLSIMNGRNDAQSVLNDNPGLKPHLEEIFLAALQLAQTKAALETEVQAAKVDAVLISLDDAFNRFYARPEGE